MSVNSLLGIGFAVAGFVACLYGVVRLRPWYYVLTNDPTDVASLSDGVPAELEGTARIDGGTIEAPLTGTECLVYEYKVLERRRTRRDSYWRTIDEGHNHTSFRIEGDTGTVLVEPRWADRRLSKEESVKVKAGTEPPERITRNFATSPSVYYGRNYKHHLDLEFVERRLDPGEPAYVFGEVQNETMAGSDQQNVDAIIKDGDSNPVFLLSDSTAEMASIEFAFPGDAFIILGFILFGVAGYLLI